MPRKSIFKISMETKGSLPNSKVMIRNVMMMVGEEARNQWIRLARARLHGTATGYVSSIGEPVYREGKSPQISITLRADTPAGKLANMQEQGCSPWDMKPAFLRSPKAKTAKSTRGREKVPGKYITIPLRLKSYGSHGASPPVMPSTIYKMANQLKIGQSLALPKKYEGYGLRSRLSPDIQRWSHYTWKTSPFQNITKVAKWPGLVRLGLPREAAGMYLIFRRVSRKSDKGSWIHPGFRSLALRELVINEVEFKIFPKILDNVFSNV